MNNKTEIKSSFSCFVQKPSSQQNINLKSDLDSNSTMGIRNTTNDRTNTFRLEKKPRKEILLFNAFERIRRIYDTDSFEEEEEEEMTHSPKQSKQIMSLIIGGIKEKDGVFLNWLNKNDVSIKYQVLTPEEGKTRIDFPLEQTDVCFLIFRVPNQVSYLRERIPDILYACMKRGIFNSKLNISYNGSLSKEGADNEIHKILAKFFNGKINECVDFGSHCHEITEDLSNPSIPIIQSLEISLTPYIGSVLNFLASPIFPESYSLQKMKLNFPQDNYYDIPLMKQGLNAMLEALRIRSTIQILTIRFSVYDARDCEKCIRLLMELLIDPSKTLFAITELNYEIEIPSGETVSRKIGSVFEILQDFVNSIEKPDCDIHVVITDKKHALKLDSKNPEILRL